MRYKLVDQMGTVIASGNQLDFNIKVDLENERMKVTTAGMSTVCDIAGKDKFTLVFEREFAAKDLYKLVPGVTGKKSTANSSSI